MIVLGVILLVTRFILAIPVLYEGQGGHGCSRAGIRGRVRDHTNRPQRRDREGKTHDQQIDSRAIALNPPVVGRWERSYRTRGLTLPTAGSFSGVRARGLRGRAPAFSEPSVGECG
jgi:hypothetical protein